MGRYEKAGTCKKTSYLSVGGVGRGGDGHGLVRGQLGEGRVGADAGVAGELFECVHEGGTHVVTRGLAKREVLFLNGELLLVEHFLLFELLLE